MTAAPRAIQPARAGLDVVVPVPGSKSITNRALLLAALADGESTLDGALVADDTVAFVDGLRSLGFEIVEAAAGRLRVRGAAGRVPASEATVWCADAGTAARFLLALCAAGHGRFTLDASAQMRRRPMGLLLEALRAQGAAFEPAGATSLPVTVVAGGLAGGSVALPGDVSSQFVSALLMAAPLARAPLTVTVDGLVSRPYVDMTLAMMAQFGVEAEREGYASFRLRPATYQARDYDVEPDASTASYFFAAAAVTGGRVTVPGLRRRGGLQGDVRFVDVLEAMGCRVTEGDGGLTVEGPRDGGDRHGRRDACGAGAPLRPQRRHGRHLGHVHDPGGDRTLRLVAGHDHRHRQRPPQGVRPHRRDGGRSAARRGADGVGRGPPAGPAGRPAGRPHRPARRPPHRDELQRARLAGTRVSSSRTPPACARRARRSSTSGGCSKRSPELPSRAEASRRASCGTHSAIGVR